MDAEAVVAVIQALRYPTDFDRSATSHHDAQPWHDSDKPALGRRTLYPTVTVADEGRYLPAGFKEA